MSIFPILPIWLMAIICGILLFIIIKNNPKNWCQIAIVVLIFIINLRIMIPSEGAKVLSNNLDVLFVVDETISVIAEDYNGNNTRLSAIQNDCKYIIKRLNGAKFSLITFDNKSRIEIPYTKDAKIISELIDFLEPIETLYSKGSNLNVALEDTIKTLKSSKEKGGRVRVLFFISDGEHNVTDSLSSYSEIKKYIDEGAVLGYGTTNGGYMKDTDRDSTGEYITYYDVNNGYNNVTAVSKIDENNLKKIASEAGIDYIHMTKQSNINNKLKKLENIVTEGLETSDKKSYEDTYYFLIIPLLILVMIEFNKFRRNAM